MKRAVFTAAKIAVTAVLLVFVISRIGLPALLETAAAFPPWAFALLAAMIVFNIVLGTINLGIFVRGLDHHVPFPRLFRYTLSAWAVGLFAPGKIGEFSILHYFRTNGISLGKGLAIALLDKMITAGALLSLALVGLYLFFPQTARWPVVAAAALLVALGGYLLFSSLGRALVRKYVLRKYAAHFTGFFAALMALLKKTQLVSLNAALTYLKWTVNALVFYAILNAMGQHIAWYWILIIFSTSTLIALLPVSISGLGVKESAAYVLFTFFPVDAKVAAGAFVMMTAVTYAVGLVALLLAPKE